MASHGPDADLSLKKSARHTVVPVQADACFLESARLDPWSRTSLQLYMILLVAALNATASGFDGVRACRQTAALGADDPYSPSSAPSTP